MKRDERGSWYLLTGLVIGVVLGLLYAWVFAPVEYIDTAPAALQAPAKDRYRAAIAAAYSANGDVVRARARLELLKDPDPYRALAEQAQRTLASGPNAAAEARALGALAAALKAPPSGAPAPTETGLPSATPPATAAPTLEPTSEPTASAAPQDLAASTPTRPLVSLTPPPPSPTPGGPFVLAGREIDCTPGLSEPQVRVRAQDAAGSPVPGIEVVLAWAGGEDRSFTGLQPELGLGYTDFSLTPEITYTLRLAPDSPPVTDLMAIECQPNNADPFWGAWVLTFVQR